jgi:hypothetical protein
MNLKHTMKTLAAALLIAAAPAIDAAPPQQHAPARQQVVQKTFATPEDAARALADAVRADDVGALLAAVGPASRSWLFSGDRVADRNDWESFLAAFERKKSISQQSDGRAFLLLDDGGWPFPAPLVRRGQGWAFDAEAGRNEMINRRVGGNELYTIQTLLAIVDAQREYVADDPDGNGFNDYARRFVSSTGKRDGLYWPVAAGEPPSPLGPLVGAAARAGYGTKGTGTKGTPGTKTGGGQPAAYHGYRYRLLSRQGGDAPGGRFDYRVGERMIGGFAVVAYPAKYGVSGVMSFIVNHDGVVFEKDLGQASAAVALEMREFNPDASWKKAEGGQDR